LSEQLLQQLESRDAEFESMQNKI